MLTEQEVARAWVGMFKGAEINPALLTRAEELLDELRAESPLRHRLAMELRELQSRHTAKETPAPRAKRTRRPRVEA